MGVPQSYYITHQGVNLRLPDFVDYRHIDHYLVLARGNSRGHAGRPDHVYAHTFCIIRYWLPSASVIVETHNPYQSDTKFFGKQFGFGFGIGNSFSPGLI